MLNVELFYRALLSWQYVQSNSYSKDSS